MDNSLDMQQVPKLEMGANSIEFCLVCGDRASGRHYGAISCEGCKGFFKRSIRKQLGYQCRGTMNCEVTKHHRNRCQYCRLQKCLSCGMRSDSVQHERKPIVDRKHDAMKNTNGDMDSDGVSVTSKSRIKKETSDTVNYLNLFQLNPLLMHAASAATTNNFQQSLSVSTSPSNIANDPSNIKLEDQFASDLTAAPSKLPNSDSMELFESVLDQKLLNDTLDMIQLIEKNLMNAHEMYDDSFVDNTNQAFFNNLQDEQQVQFKIQIPNLLPKMHFICEMGSRVLFKSIDWLRDIQVWQTFDNENQCSDIFRNNWVDLLIVGIAQVIETSSQAVSMKSMILSALTNFVKSLIIYTNSEQTRSKNGGKGDVKNPASANKVKKMVTNILILNSFIDSVLQLQLDDIEFAHMRLLCLFNSNKCLGFENSERSKIKKFEQRVLGNLRNYLKIKDNSRDYCYDRTMQIYHSLTILFSLDAKIIEFLFFNNLVGFIRIENVIPYIMNLNSATLECKQERETDSYDGNITASNNNDERYYNNFNECGDELAS